MGTMVFRPEEIYKSVRNVAPDLITHFGGLYWRSIGGVGYSAFHVQENDTGPDDCNHSQYGSFILASSNNPLSGEVAGAHILDLAPTMLELGGYDTPNSMQGKSLVAGKALTPGEKGFSASEEELVRERLSGLGYIS
jgi:predicted AlkP superfamily phosphohydrolase/phosphomutase